LILTSRVAFILGDWSPVREAPEVISTFIVIKVTVFPFYRKETKNGHIRATQALLPGGELYDRTCGTEAQRPITDTPHLS